MLGTAAPRPAPRPGGGAAAARAAAADTSLIVTAPSPASPTPPRAALPRPPRPPRAAPGNAAKVGRVRLAVIPPGQAPEPAAGAAAERCFCHSVRPRSVSMANTLSELPPTYAR